VIKEGSKIHGMKFKQALRLIKIIFFAVKYFIDLSIKVFIQIKKHHFFQNKSFLTNSFIKITGKAENNFR